MTLFTLIRPLLACIVLTLAEAGANTAPDATEAPPVIDSATRLAGDGRQRILLLGNGRRIAFKPVARRYTPSIEFRSTDRRLSLRGANGTYRLSDESGREWRFVAGRPLTRRDSDRGWASIPDSPGVALSDDGDHCPVTCDDESRPPPAAFEAGPTVPGASTLDARPASCRSYFTDYPPIERGIRIESGVAVLPDYLGFDHTPRSFPSVDFISATELVSLTSRDLGAPSYDESHERDAVFDSLLQDGLEIERRLLEPLRTNGHVEHRELGSRVRIEATPGRRVVLELVIRHGLATPGQIAQIERARLELRQRSGIELRVVEIP